MSEQMKVAVDMMEQLRDGIESYDVSLIDSDPNFVFIKALKDRLINLGFSPNGFSIDDVVSNFNADISYSTEKEVAEYLGISFAEIIYDMHKKFGDEFEFWPTVIRNLSVNFVFKECVDEYYR